MLPQFLAESLHMNKQSIALLVGVALWLTACNSSKPSTPAGARQAVVPLGDAGALVFSASGAETVRGSQRSAFAASLPSGAPLAAANDPSSGWSALAYNDAIVVVNASEARVKRVDGVSWSSAPTALGIGGTTVGTLEDGTITAALATICALRMRVNRSAMGSLMLMLLSPADYQLALVTPGIWPAKANSRILARPKPN